MTTRKRRIVYADCATTSADIYRAGYRTKKEIRDGLLSGRIAPGKLRGYQVESFQTLCDWVGLKANLIRTQCPHCKSVLNEKWEIKPLDTKHEN